MSKEEEYKESSSLEDYNGFDFKKDREEEFRQEWIGDQMTEALNDYINDYELELLRDFVENGHEDEFKQFCKDCYNEDVALIKDLKTNR